MVLNKSEKKRIIKALRAARPYIKSEQCEFVCWALAWASGEKKIDRMDYALAQNYILLLINPYSSVFDWYRGTQYLVEPFVQPPTSWREYRLAWIDHMIEELSK